MPSADKATIADQRERLAIGIVMDEDRWSGLFLCLC